VPCKPERAGLAGAYRLVCGLTPKACNAGWPRVIASVGDTTEMDTPLAAEVSAARQRLARLKERLSHRAACRRSAASEPDPLAGRQPGNVAPLRDAGTHSSEVSSLEARAICRAVYAPMHHCSRLSHTTMHCNLRKFALHVCVPLCAHASCPCCACALAGIVLKLLRVTQALEAPRPRPMARRSPPRSRCSG